MKLTLAALLTLGAAATNTLSAEPVTLATYNIHSAVPNGKSNQNYFAGPDDLRNVKDVLTTAGAHIIALQEVRNQWEAPDNFSPEPAAPNMPLLLARYLGMNYAYASTLDARPGFFENRKYREWGNGWQWTNNGAQLGKYGNAVLSKFGMGMPETINLPLGDAGAVGDEARNALRVEIKDVPSLGNVVVYGTHFQHNNGHTREKQMRHLLEVARADTSTATVFLMGDFNHTPHKGEPELLEIVKQAGFHDLAAEFAEGRGEKPHHTMMHGITPIRIDYIFASRPLKVKDVVVLQTDVSDHLPLAITVEP